MVKPSRKYFYVLLAAITIVVLLYFGMWRSAAIKVETARVERKDFRATIDAEGRTRYHDRFTVTAPISGKMFRLSLHEGNEIPKGYVITRIDPSPPRPTDPTQAPESSVFPYAYTVYAPAGGKVTRIYEASERFIQAGTPIIEISQPSRLEIVIDVLSSDATRIKPNMKVIVENWGGDGDVQARVRNVEPQAFTKISALGVEEQRVNVIADFASVPRELGDNYRVDARIVLWEAPDVLQIPTSAIFHTGEKWSVFVVQGSTAVRREIEIGHRSPSAVEVNKNLSDGEVVIVHPPNKVSDGSRVESE